MDVRKAAMVAALTLAVSACGKTSDESDVFPLSNPKCQSAEMKNQFIVRWKDGRRTLERGQSRDQFLRDFVRPNLDRLHHVEHNRRIELDKDLSLKARASSGEYADNWGQQYTHVDEMWQAGVKGKGVVVAVVDSGADVNHEKLSNQVAYNKGETGTDSFGQNKATNGVDDDQNGLVDDYAGYDFANDRGLTGDNAQHGTHVSGIVLAEHSDTVALGADHVQGVAPQAKLLPIAFIGSGGGGTLFDAIQALSYAGARGAKVINASWGGAECSPELRDSIAGLAANKAIFVSASGNGGLDGQADDIDMDYEFPASYNLPNQITVGALGVNGWEAGFSNYGANSVHILAPGVDIFSTVPGDGIASMTGTSMATPFVTGAVALLLSHRPSATVDQIRQALYRSAVTSSLYKNASRGALDFREAIAELERLIP